LVAGRIDGCYWYTTKIMGRNCFFIPAVSNAMATFQHKTFCEIQYASWVSGIVVSMGIWVTGPWWVHIEHLYGCIIPKNLMFTMYNE